MSETIGKPATEAVDLDRLVLWRDLGIGETLHRGDRILQPDMTWATWRREDIIIDRHTFPCQRIVDPQNVEDWHPSPRG